MDIAPDADKAPRLEYAPAEESQTAGWIVLWLICGACSIVLGLCLLILFVLGWN